eukprot:scaffold1525_cov142-Cylindrotheca_fusiformis.AAC.38
MIGSCRPDQKLAVDAIGETRCPKHDHSAANLRACSVQSQPVRNPKTVVRENEPHHHLQLFTAVSDMRSFLVEVMKADYCSFPALLFFSSIPAIFE